MHYSFKTFRMIKTWPWVAIVSRIENNPVNGLQNKTFLWIDIQGWLSKTLERLKCLKVPDFSNNFFKKLPQKYREQTYWKLQKSIQNLKAKPKTLKRLRKAKLNFFNNAQFFNHSRLRCLCFALFISMYWRPIYFKNPHHFLHRSTKRLLYGKEWWSIR